MAFPIVTWVNTDSDDLLSAERLAYEKAQWRRFIDAVDVLDDHQRELDKERLAEERDLEQRREEPT